MEKILALILAAALTLSLAACGGGSEPQSSEAEPSETMQVDKGLLSVEVTMLAGFFVDIQRNQDFSQFDIYVDPALYSDWDFLSVLGFYAVGVYYQSFAGVDDEDIEIVVNFIDNDTQELMETASYQETLQSMEADDTAAES